MSTASHRQGFSLVELLVVIVVLITLFGLAISVPKRDEREAQVKSAADELASVLRATRSMAMEKRVHYAVVFNIQNTPGTTGRVLSNKTGGHWYRVIGPGNDLGNWHMMTGFPPLLSRDMSSRDGAWTGSYDKLDNPIRHHIEAVERAWVGEKRVLPPGKVRFIALTDQDNGNYRKTGDTYAPTYPRPWFGWWDPASKRLYPWGGYDPDLAMTQQTGDSFWKHKPRSRGGRIISHSGFFYEGYDGPISGCIHPSDRLVVDDTNDDSVISKDPARPAQGNDDFTKRYPLWRKDEPRPLINAQWQDCMIIFRPDGTVFLDWMRLRHEFAKNYENTGGLFYDPSLDTTNGDATVPAGKYHFIEHGPGDMCNRLNEWEGYPRIMERTGAEGSSFVKRSGYHFITIGPDIAKDTDQYSSAHEALMSMNPMYRIGISPFGEVVVIKVRTVERQGRVLDTAVTGAKWNDKSTTDQYYRNHLLTNPDGSQRGLPVTDTVTTEMLSDRKWWWQ